MESIEDLMDISSKSKEYFDVPSQICQSRHKTVSDIRDFRSLIEKIPLRHGSVFQNIESVGWREELNGVIALVKKSINSEETATFSSEQQDKN
jgi:hypothetical protein